MARLQKSDVIGAAIENVFAKHTNIQDICQLLCGILDIELIGAFDDRLQKGQNLELFLGFKGISRRCSIRVEDIVANTRIEIRQVQGLYKSFNFCVQFAKHGDTGTLVTDSVDYRLPLGLFGHLIDDLFLRSEIEKIINFHLEALKKTFEL